MASETAKRLRAQMATEVRDAGLPVAFHDVPMPTGVPRIIYVFEDGVVLHSPLGTPERTLGELTLADLGTLIEQGVRGQDAEEALDEITDHWAYLLFRHDSGFELGKTDWEVALHPTPGSWDRPETRKYLDGNEGLRRAIKRFDDQLPIDQGPQP